jgi:cell division protein FtsW (lipid II flippase)
MTHQNQAALRALAYTMALCLAVGATVDFGLHLLVLPALRATLEIAVAQLRPLLFAVFLVGFGGLLVIQHNKYSRTHARCNPPPDTTQQANRTPKE